MWCPLISRQRETLEWASLRKTTQDIATINGLSSATIEKHLKIARNALAAQSTAYSVKRKTWLNLLTARVVAAKVRFSKEASCKSRRHRAPSPLYSSAVRKVAA